MQVYTRQIFWNCLLALSLKKGPVECAKVCAKSWVILVHVCACFVSCVFFWPLVSIFSSYIIFYKKDMYLIEKALPHCQNLHYTKFAIHIVRKFMPLLTIAFFSLVLFNKHAITCNFHVIHNQSYLQCKELPSKLQRYWLSFYFWPFFQVLFFSSSLVLDKSFVPNIS